MQLGHAVESVRAIIIIISSIIYQPLPRGIIITSMAVCMSTIIIDAVIVIEQLLKQQRFFLQNNK